jgi:hypothetical protein
MENAGITHNRASLWTEYEAAAYLLVCVQTLRKDRTFKHHLKVPFLRIGGRVVYRQSDLDAWLDQQVVNPVAAPPPKPPAEPKPQPVRKPGRPRKSEILQPEIID